MKMIEALMKRVQPADVLRESLMKVPLSELRSFAAQNLPAPVRGKPYDVRRTKTLVRELVKWHTEKNISVSAGGGGCDEITTMMGELSLNEVNEVAEPEAEPVVVKKAKKSRAKKGGSKRKRVECNAYELVAAALLANPYIQSVDELKEFIKSSPENLMVGNLDEQLKDLDTRDATNVAKWMCGLRSFREEHGDVAGVYLTGKTARDFPEITALNEGLDRKLCKADVYVRLTSGRWVGVSVKQSKDATKSNQALEGKRGDGDGLLSCGRELREFRLDFLRSVGFTKFRKEDRKSVNALFYDEMNPYWVRLREVIEREKGMYIGRLKSYLYGAAPYDVYEYSGEEFEKYDGEFDVSRVNFRYWVEYRDRKSGEERQAAKLWQLWEDPYKKYRVEVRWKGNCFGPSPQFQFHEIHGE